MATIHEECGVFGVCVAGMTHAASVTYNALYALQHRGQESAGMAINDDGVITSHKDVGLVSEVFTPEVLEHLGPGSMAVGHVRYATTGRKSRTNAQPMVINHVKGSMALAHNGNLTNAAELREKLELSGAIFHTTSDTEVIAYTITGARLKAPSIEEAVSVAMDVIQGAYSLVLLSPPQADRCPGPQRLPASVHRYSGRRLCVRLGELRSGRHRRPLPPGCGTRRNRHRRPVRPAEHTDPLRQGQEQPVCV